MHDPKPAQQGSSRPLLGEYLVERPLRVRDSFQVVAARRAEDGRGCVLVLPGTAADRDRVREALAEVERVHALVDHPMLAKVAARGEVEGTPYLELACDAVADGIEILRRLAASDRRVPYAASDAFIYHLRIALDVAHETRDPRTGAPICLGRMSAGNVLFAASGRFWLVGLGRNFPVERDDGSIDRACTFCQAPEVAMGAPPSPVGDYVALVLFMRSLLPLVEFSGPIGRIFHGDIRPEDAELIDCLRWVDQRVLGEAPPLRASIAEAVEVADRIRALADVRLDLPGFERQMAAILEQDAASAPTVVTVGPDAAWIEGPGGERNRLGRPLRRILLALVRNQGIEGRLTVWDLLEAGWPGEQPTVEAGTNRVYVALTRLRGMGLRDAIERFEDGYRLAPRVEVRFVE